MWRKVWLPTFFVLAAAIIPTTAFASHDPGYRACYNDGFSDGADGQFNQEYLDYCETEGSYIEGFLDGCLSVEGNTEEICDSAMDS